MALSIEARAGVGGGGGARGDAAVRGRPWLRSGHRLFFLFAALQGFGSLAVWLLALQGWLPLAASWHGHELIWGFAAAAIAGFLSAAVPKWTNSGLFAGTPVLGLVALWLAGRLAMALDVAPWVDVVFLPVLAATVFRRLWRVRNVRNYQIAAMLLALTGCNVLWHLGQTTAATRGAVLVLIALIGLISGRILPGFTRNAAVARGDEPGDIYADERLERWVVPGLALAAAVELLAPMHPVAGVLQLALALLFALRARTYGFRSSLREPIVWVLHVAHGFIPLGLLLMGVAALTPTLRQAMGLALPVSPMAGLHALTAGGIGGMILAVASRAARGHAGLPLHAGPATVASYALVLGGAALRVGFALAAPWLGDGGQLGLRVAGTAWALGWLVFAVAHAPMLLRARRDGRPG